MTDSSSSDSDSDDELPTIQDHVENVGELLTIISKGIHLSSNSIENIKTIRSHLSEILDLGSTAEDKIDSLKRS